MHVRARVASVRTTPSRSEDVERITRVTVDIHDMPDDFIGWLSLQSGKTIGVEFGSPPALPLTPLEEAISQALPLTPLEPDDVEASDEYTEAELEATTSAESEDWREVLPDFEATTPASNGVAAQGDDPDDDEPWDFRDVDSGTPLTPVASAQPRTPPPPTPTRARRRR